MEEWRDVKGYEGYYQISNKGSIKSLKRTFYSGSNLRIKKIYEEKILKQQSYKQGYKYVVLCKDGISKKLKVHRIIAQAFIPNPENKPCIDHINAKRDDNRIENLRWATWKENSENSISRYRISMSRIGDKNPKRKTMKKVAKIDPISNIQIEVFNGIKMAADIIGVNRSSIYRAIDLNRICKGFLWKFAS